MSTTALRHFAILDAHRGIAAISVLLFHICAPLHLNWVAPHGYLAVDFFFLLSGLVIDQAYGARLADPRFRSRFLVLRMARLWPMILLGTLLGGIVSAAGLITKGGLHDITSLVKSLVFGLLLLPLGRMPTTNYIFPFNGPLWSLFYEMVANLVYAFGLRWSGNLPLGAIALTAAGGIAGLAFYHGDLELGAGYTPLGFAGGVNRVLFSFLVGVLISRNLNRLPRLGLSALVLTVILTIALASPFPQRNALFDVVCVLLLFPLLIGEGSACNVSPRLLPTCKFLGDISYPLYGIHYPIMRAFLYVQVSRGFTGATLVAFVVVEVIVCLTAAYLAMRLFETPFREGLMRVAWRGLKSSKPAGCA